MDKLTSDYTEMCAAKYMFSNLKESEQFAFGSQVADAWKDGHEQGFERAKKMFDFLDKDRKHEVADVLWMTERAEIEKCNTLQDLYQMLGDMINDTRDRSMSARESWHFIFRAYELGLETGMMAKSEFDNELAKTSGKPLGTVAD